jgi:hypothetical protein
MLIGTWIGTPHRSRASLAAKYQSRCSANILHKFSGFFGGGVAHPANKKLDSKAMRKDFLINILSQKKNNLGI